MNREPVLISGVVQVLVVLAAAFGFDLSAEQLAGFVAVVMVVGGFIARQFAWSRKSVEKATGVPAKVAEARL